MKKFIGYHIIGAATKEDAENEKGLILWSRNKPRRFTRFFNRVLLGIYWVDKEKVFEERGKTAQSNVNSEVKVEMPKLVQQKESKKDGGTKPRVSIKQ
jgi:hypothetical protein